MRRAVAARYIRRVAPERDLFANFERMRREMDELFGDVFGGGVLGSRHRGGFSPAVDVFYEGDPPRAVVHAELAGIDPDEIGLEIEGRELVIAGHRRPVPVSVEPVLDRPVAVRRLVGDLAVVPRR